LDEALPNLIDDMKRSNMCYENSMMILKYMSQTGANSNMYKPQLFKKTLHLYDIQ